MALGQIEKQFGKGSVMRMGEKETMAIATVPTGALALDIALGVGGLPRGRVVEIYGPESSGKSTLAMHVVAEAQRNGGICAYIDAEHAMDPVYAANIGVDIDELLISQPDTGEQALEIADMLVRSGALDVVVIDSVAALTPGPRSRARWATATSASRPASCRRRCASSPPTSTRPRPSASSSTSCERRSA
ncbi:MAG: ATPase domain-containing protein [Acidimicrobiales bacterium]